MEILIKSLIDEWHGLLGMLPHVALGVVVFALLVWAGSLLARGVLRFLERGKLTTIHGNFIYTAIRWLCGMVGFILALNLMGLRSVAASLLAGGGVTAVILGFAFREIGENFLAGIMLALSRPFELGDLIESETMQGEVRGIELRHTHIRSADGRDIYIPSAQIINRPLINYTRDGLSRPSFTLGIDYAEDPREARRLLHQAVEATDGVLEEPRSTVTLSALGPQYVELEVTFWIDTFRPGTNLSRIRTEVMERCRSGLREAGFALSSDASTNIAVGGRRAVDIRLLERPAAG